ncbi:hypothetical protein JTB14_000988 [Gonioctena quinquepunctata]|nr:hypothetical protein JTB14_000988 [Gonioctena quinquepunctata]
MKSEEIGVQAHIKAYVRSKAIQCGGEGFSTPKITKRKSEQRGKLNDGKKSTEVLAGARGKKLIHRKVEEDSKEIIDQPIKNITEAEEQMKKLQQKLDDVMKENSELQIACQTELLVAETIDLVRPNYQDHASNNKIQNSAITIPLLMSKMLLVAGANGRDKYEVEAIIKPHALDIELVKSAVKLSGGFPKNYVVVIWTEIQLQYITIH